GRPTAGLWIWKVSSNGFGQRWTVTRFFSRRSMISNSSTASIDALDLSATDGLLLLITRALDGLKPGEVLEILSDNRSVEHDLAAWCRLTANRWLGSIQVNGRMSHRVQKGTVRRVLTERGLDWGNRAKIQDGVFNTRDLLLGETGRILENANRSDGFAPRGA